jgi:serine/threonine-protein kinase
MEAYPTPGSVVAGRYRIDALLGEGGMGAVFRATELAANLAVALKFPSPEMRIRPGMASRFANESTAASRIACEHVVQIFGVETTEGGTPFIVMELLEGRDLDAVVEAEAPLLPARAVHFTLQILRALQIAHAAGVVHRDLKPSNALVVSRDGDPDFVKLIDFGITKIIGDDKGLTKTSTTLGTPAYMAPEQAKSAKAADARSDLYSVGVILYELLTRRRPFEGESQNEVVIKICTEPPMPIRTLRPDLPAGLASAVEHALVKAQLGRFPTAESFAAALEPFADARSAGVLARIHGGAGPVPGGPMALAPTPMADDVPPPRKPSGTAMMDESLLPPEMQAALHAPISPAAPAAPAAAHVVITPPGGVDVIAAREGAGKTVVGDVAPMVFANAAAPGAPIAGAPMPPPAVPYVQAPPPGSYDDDDGGGGGRGVLFGALGLVAVALIGGGLYFAFRGSPGGGTPSAGSGGNGGGKVEISDDDGTGQAKKKKKKSPDEAPDDTSTAADTTTKPGPTTTTRPTTTTTTTTTTTAATTGPTTLPSTKPSTTTTGPTTLPSVVPTGLPTGYPDSGTMLPPGWPTRPQPTTNPTTPPTTVPTTVPTTAPTPTTTGPRKPRFGGG